MYACVYSGFRRGGWGSPLRLFFQDLVVNLGSGPENQCIVESGEFGCEVSEVSASCRLISLCPLSLCLNILYYPFPCPTPPPSSPLLIFTMPVFSFEIRRSGITGACCLLCGSRAV